MTTAAQAAVCDRAAVAAGTPSFELMLRAGTQSAAVILRDYAHRLSHGVLVCAGTGNNGGDAYVVAAQLARAGVRVRLIAAAAPRTIDAQRVEQVARQFGDGTAHAMLRWEHASHVVGAGSHDEALVVDGLLGTGHQGTLRDSMRAPLAELARRRNSGATVVALDVPSGLDATTGACAAGMVSANVTLMYGTVKRGVLLSRAACGRLILLDIGLGEHARAADGDGAWRMFGTSELTARLPSIAWNAHKGQRGHVAITGGAAGMAGAVILAARAALASGAGIVRAWVDEPGVFAMQQSVPQAIADAWVRAPDRNPDQRAPVVSVGPPAPWGSALAIGPGLGRTQASSDALSGALTTNPLTPCVLDADALTLLSISARADSTADVRVTDDVLREELLREEASREDSSRDGVARHVHPADRIRSLCRPSRPVVCTPHVGEFARLIGEAVSDNWSERATQASRFAERADVTLLLKGTPTLVATPDGAPAIAIARGSAVLATGGSGDMLTGIIGTLLAQGVAPRDAAVVGATVHGLAAELAAHHARGIRGVTLDDVLLSLPAAWRALATATAREPGVLMEWPAPEGTRIDAVA